MRQLLKDLRFGIRLLRNNAVVTVVAVVTLALGIGANTAIFSVVNAVLLRPLAYEDPERLTMVFESNPAKGWREFMASPANFVDWQTQSQSFEQLAAYRTGPLNVTGGEEPERIPGARVSPTLFTLLGVVPILGRTFSNEEDRPGADRVVVISYGLWQRRLGADPNIGERELLINGKNYAVLGVLPAGFRFPRQTDIWMPIAFTGEDLRNRGTHTVDVIGRLKREVTVDQAHAEMGAIAHELEQQYPSSNTGWGVRVVPLLDTIVGDIRPSLRILLVAVGFVLLIACANVANLLLERATIRHSEMAIRRALGAGQWNLIRQLLAESLLIALAGGLVGLFLVFFGIRLIVSISPDTIPRSDEIGMDANVLGFTVLISILTGLIFGVVPTIHASRQNLAETLIGGNRTETSSRRSSLSRRLLVVSEVALSLMLLICASLLIKSFQRLRTVDPGFDADHVLTLQVSLPKAKYGEGGQQIAFLQEVLQRTAGLPGVEASGATTTLPLIGNDLMGFIIEGREPPKPNERPSATYYAVSPDYFRAMGIALIKGRYFTEADAQGTHRVMVINETLARQYFGEEEPLGQYIQLTDGRKTREIIGVVADVSQKGLDAEATPQVYEPFYQNPLNFFTMTVRTRRPQQEVAAAIRSVILDTDRDQPVSSVKSMEQILSDWIAPRRLVVFLLAIFAVIASAMAAIGLYGVIAYSVAQRTHEIGVRIALGAQRADVVRLVIEQAAKLTIVGIALGLVGAFILTRLLSVLLFGVGPGDPSTYISVSFVLSLVMLVASYVPAHLATRVDPITALRHE